MGDELKIGEYQVWTREGKREAERETTTVYEQR